MKYALMLLQLVPVLMDIMRKLEEIMPESHKGALKLEMLRTILAETYPAAMEMWGAIEKIVAVLVTLFNTHGLFKKD